MQDVDEISPNTYKFRYRLKVFKGSRLEITAQLRAIKNDPKYAGIPEEIQLELNNLFEKVKNQAFPKQYRKNAISFLNALYTYDEFVIVYNDALQKVIKKLKKDIKYIDFKLERQFTKSKIALDRVKLEDSTNQKEIVRLGEDLQKSQIRLVCHRWMQKKFENYQVSTVVKEPDQLIKEFKKTEAAKVFLLFKEKKTAEIENYLEHQIIDFFYTKSIPEIDLDKFELRYINKI